MRQFLLLFFCFAGVNTFAQSASRLTPNQGGESGVLSSISVAYLGPDDHVSAGYVALDSEGSDQSSITRFGCMWVDPNSKRLSQGKFRGLEKTMDGGLIAVGQKDTNSTTLAYICRLDVNLDTLWTKTFSRTTQDVLYDVDEADDGSIFSVLVSGSSSSPEAVIIKLDAAGNLIWSKVIPSTPSTSVQFRLKCLGSNIVIAGVQANFSSNDDIFIRVLDSSGNELLHRVYGDANAHDELREIFLSGTEITILTNIGSTPIRTGVIRLDSNFNLATASIYTSTQSLFGTELLVDAVEGLFVGGWITGSDGNGYSVVWKIHQDGSVAWTREVNLYGYVCAELGIEGVKLIVPTYDGAFGVMMTYVSASSGNVVGSACELLGTPNIIRSTYPSFHVYSVGLEVLSNGLLSETKGSKMLQYLPITEPCGTVLPAELLSFTVSFELGGNRAFWSTASETGNHYYSLERSEDAENFIEVSRTYGLGDSQSIVWYEAFDDDAPDGPAYYRLSQTDLDGSTSVVSEIVLVFPIHVTGSSVYKRLGESMDLANGHVLKDQAGRTVAAGQHSVRLATPGVFFLQGPIQNTKVFVN